MATMLYSEINILAVIILSIIALKASAFGFGASAKNKLFVTSVCFAAAANCFDFLWNMGITEYMNIPVSAMQTINFMYFMSFGFSAYFGFYIPKRFRKAVS